MGLLAKRAGLIDTENTFRIGPQIRAIEEEGKKVIKCNLGEPDFPVPDFIKEEVKGSIPNSVMEEKKLTLHRVC